MEQLSPAQQTMSRLLSGVYFDLTDDERNRDTGWASKFPTFSDVRPTSPEVRPTFPDVRSNAQSRPTSPNIRCMPLLSVDVEMKIDGNVGRTRLSQTFTNIADAAIPEAHYTFPLYDGAAITSFRCEIGDYDVLEGQVRPKAEAKRVYQRAIAKMESAALVEEHTPEVHVRDTCWQHSTQDRGQS